MGSLLPAEHATLLAHIVRALPWIFDLLTPEAQKRVRDILPEKGASEKVAEDLRRRGT